MKWKLSKQPLLTCKAGSTGLTMGKLNPQPPPPSPSIAMYCKTHSMGEATNQCQTEGLMKSSEPRCSFTTVQKANWPYCILGRWTGWGKKWRKLRHLTDQLLWDRRYLLRVLLTPLLPLRLSDWQLRTALECPTIGLNCFFMLLSLIAVVNTSTVWRMLSNITRSFGCEFQEMHLSKYLTHIWESDAFHMFSLSKNTKLQKLTASQHYRADFQPLLTCAVVGCPKKSTCTCFKPTLHQVKFPLTTIAGFGEQHLSINFLCCFHNSLSLSSCFFTFSCPKWGASALALTALLPALTPQGWATSLGTTMGDATTTSSHGSWWHTQHQTRGQKHALWVHVLSRTKYQP